MLNYKNMCTNHIFCELEFLIFFDPGVFFFEIVTSVTGVAGKTHPPPTLSWRVI